MPSHLAEVHIEGQRRLRVAVAGLVGRVWQGLGSWDEPDVPRFLALAVPTVLAGQRRSVSLTDAYLARALGRQPLGVEPDGLVGAGARAGTPPEEQWRRPFVTHWAALSAGKLFADALHVGFARATEMAAFDVQAASRGAFQAVQDADDAIRGYQRVSSGGCDYCQAIDGAFIKNADAMPLHPHCGCTLEAITESVRASPLPDSVAVHEHGEMGALIGAPDQHFTSL